MAQHVHPRLLQWLQLNYPKPQIDPDWLKDCSDWLRTDHGLSPDSNFHAFIATFEAQLLSSDLRDSMLHGTGLPTHAARPDTNTILAGPPVLVEIAAMTEIAHSAFNLEQIRVVREERTRAGNTTDDIDTEEGDIDVDEGPPPKYPRGMLKFELTDGAISLPAIEDRPLPGVVLDVTPLGCKMHLKNVKIRNGIARLEPETVVVKGYSNKDREENQRLDFARGLRERMGLPLEPIPPPARSPLRDISPPAQPEPVYNDDEILENRKRRIPSASITVTDPQATSTQVKNRPIASSSRVTSASARVTTTSTTSPYFPSASQIGTQNRKTSRPLFARSIIDMTQDDKGKPTPTHHNAQQLNSHRVEEAKRTRDGKQGNGRGENLVDTKEKGKSDTNVIDEDEFDENIFLDQALLESLDRAEMEALRTTNEPTPIHPSAGSSSTPFSNGISRHTNSDVIELADDDDDCDDKENIPVATRHVRRRTDDGNISSDKRGSQPVQDVIDLSDSD